MRVVKTLSAAIVLVHLLLVPPALAADGGRFGDVHLYQARGPVRGLVVLFSDVAGWSGVDDQAAVALADIGATVVGVDTPAYLRRLDQTSETCHAAFADAESLSRQLQRERGAAVYLTPILAGIGEGASLARAMLSQAPANTIAGATMMHPSESVAGLRPLCARLSASPVSGGFVYPPASDLPGFLVTAATDGSTPVQDTGKGLVALIEPHLGAVAPQAGDVASLPLIELPAAGGSDLLAIVLSGDGGWRDLDKTIAEKLSGDGLSVVGWDSLRYFWRQKTPDQIAADLGAVIEFYAAHWHANHVALVGYSFGADVLPFAYNRLPLKARDKVAMISLLGYSQSADFEITVSGWLGEPPSATALPTAPETGMIMPSLIQCFYGETEDDSGCPELAKRDVEIIRTTGGHHFDGNYSALAARIEAGLRQRIRSIVTMRPGP